MAIDDEDAFVRDVFKTSPVVRGGPDIMAMMPLCEFIDMRQHYLSYRSVDMTGTPCTCYEGKTEFAMEVSERDNVDPESVTLLGRGTSVSGLHVDAASRVRFVSSGRRYVVRALMFVFGWDDNEDAPVPAEDDDGDATVLYNAMEE